VHLERYEQRPVGVVLVADRGTEEGEQRVPGELLDVAVVPADDAAQGRDHGVDDLDQLLWVEAVGERCKARDVGKEGSDEAPFLRKTAAGLDKLVGNGTGDEAAESVLDAGLGLRRRLRAHCAAMAAEAHAFRVLPAACGTEPGCHRCLRG
jgi:hypothetical protein